MIEISKLTKTYDRGTKALKDVNITIDDGEFVFITGRSGSGKSTLIKILLKEVEPTSGRVVVNDMDLRKMPRRYVPKYRRRLGVVFQDFRLLNDRNVYENAVEFSGGEMQRLLLARALYKNAPILVLDEPTAALDAITESALYRQYNEMTRGCTAIYISHRLASTRFCDRIILVEGGKIAEEGTHEALMAQGGAYAALFAVQSKYYQEEVRQNEAD